MKCAVVTTVGPGCEALYESCRATIEQAWTNGAGPFSELAVMPAYDPDGARGRSACRDDAIQMAEREGCDWLCFLDASDLLAGTAFSSFERHHAGHDAIWGMIVTNRPGTGDVALMDPQMPPTGRIVDVSESDPERSLRSGYFVRTACAASMARDPALRTDEDLQYYWQLWERFRCVKAPEVFAISRRDAATEPTGNAPAERWGAPADPRQSQRRFESLDAEREVDAVTLDGQRFQVRRHWFWPEYAGNWEEHTWQFYRRFVEPARPVLDLGCWVGPTALFAARLGARRIVAVDGNPRTAEHLAATRALNPDSLGGLMITNAVVANQRGTTSFGNLDGSEALSSASSTRGRGFTVPTFTIRDIMDASGVEDPCILKMDLEGSEREVLGQILPFQGKATTINLSLHPPFWPAETREATARELLGIMRGFTTWTADGEALDADRLLGMMLYAGDAPPAWGTKFGNFFEVVLTPRTAAPRAGTPATAAAAAPVPAAPAIIAPAAATSIAPLRREDGKVVVEIPAELLFTEDFRALGRPISNETPEWFARNRLWSDLSMMRLWPHNRLAEYFRSGRGGHETYTEWDRQGYMLRNLPAPRDRDTLLLYRFEQFRRLEGLLRAHGPQHPDFVFDVKYVGASGKFMQLDGHHRSAFLRAAGVRRMSVRMDAGDHAAWYNEDALAKVREVIARTNRSEFYTPVLHPRFYESWPVRDFAYKSRLEHILEFFGPTRFAGSMVDIGSNIGFFSHHFLREGVKITGFDPDPNHHQMAVALSGLYGLAGDFRNEGFEDSPNNATYNGAIFLTVLYHMIGRGTHEKFLRKIDATVSDFVLWESGSEPEREKAEFFRHTRFRHYRKIADTYGTGRARELGVFCTPYYAEAVQ